MKAVIIGAGRIGCGHAGELLHASGHEVVFLARDPSWAAHLNRMGGYRVRLVDGTRSRTVAVEGIRAVWTGDAAQTQSELIGADVIVTAVGATCLFDIAPLIAAALRKRTTPVNILVFENMSDGGDALKRLVAAHLPAGFALDCHGFCGTLVSRIVTQRLGDPIGSEPVTFVADSTPTFAVDGKRAHAPLPEINGMVVADDFAAWMERKLYIFSAGHATCAYLGHLKGYRFIHAAIRDPEIRAAVLDAMAEGQRGIAQRYGQAFAGGRDDLLEIIRRFENAALDDSVSRVARDPSRKLGAGDRLLGSARLAQAAGVRPHRLLLAAAAAYCFRDPQDESAVRLQTDISLLGLPSVLRRVSALNARRGLGKRLAQEWIRISGHGERVLLSMDRMMWS
jgi:mannitol-1-phosphate 5-dehydrogenase